MELESTFPEEATEGETPSPDSRDSPEWKQTNTTYVIAKPFYFPNLESLSTQHIAIKEHYEMTSCSWGPMDSWSQCDVSNICVCVSHVSLSSQSTVVFGFLHDPFQSVVIIYL